MIDCGRRSERAATSTTPVAGAITRVPCKVRSVTRTIRLIDTLSTLPD